ncbi:uncharacterized protein HaLaN_19088 [Haematococcus lacustris]|uniref:HNH nuclease domain-containing protein n=1 Tax=Haematococcus lacustris TaxID=44745 RepID=A0A699ZTV0_HAELA|nr:uncharacterized protein HaLaN_19088 [Haematococcus lacustris]
MTRGYHTDVGLTSDVHATVAPLMWFCMLVAECCLVTIAGAAQAAEGQAAAALAAVAQAAAAQATAAQATAANHAHVTGVLERIDENFAFFSRVLPMLMVHLKKQFAPPTTASRGSNASFRQSLLQFYGVALDKGKLRCMVLNELLPKEFICAGHLLARSLKDYARPMLGVSDISDPRNGLLWNSAIEEAYELQKICFSYVRACIFRLHVVDKKLMHIKLGDCGKDK